MSNIVPITVAYGDGIGPEITQAVLNILKNAQARIRVETIEVGHKLYEKGYSSGITQDSWDSLERTRVILKGPITTPEGKGYKSLNVTLRKALGLYANIRPVRAYTPFVSSLHPQMDIVIIRENEEDLYAGIEYRHSHNMRESVRLISETGCRKIINYAFDYAIKNGRRKVSCFTKANIMKISDGLFLQIFNEIAVKYPQIESNHYLIDIATAKLATKPELFDVIVTSNLFGDIISDVAAEISGSVGLAGSANIGADYALFEAVHGSAPDIAGMDIADPSGLLNAAIMMLVHIGQSDIACLIENAWKVTLEDGIHTANFFNADSSISKVGTQEFARAVSERLGRVPTELTPAKYDSEYATNSAKLDKATAAEPIKIDYTQVKKLVGFDIFLQMDARSADMVAHKILPLTQSQEMFRLQTIASKGLVLWPRYDEYLLESDHWCCRFIASEPAALSHYSIASFLAVLAENKIDFIKIENLYSYDGQRGYSLAQGE